jgi:hypothetical protein
LKILLDDFFKIVNGNIEGPEPGTSQLVVIDKLLSLGIQSGKVLDQGA